MWACTRLWLLFIALLHLTDVRALGVWSKRPAQDCYRVDGKTSLDQLQETASFPDGAHISTALKDENRMLLHKAKAQQFSQGLGSQHGSFQTQQGTNHLNSAPALAVSLQAAEAATTANSSSTSNISSAYGGSQSSTGYGLFQGLGSQYGDGQSRAPSPAFVTQQASGSAVSSGSTSSTSSSYGGSPSRGSTGYGLSQGLASQHGRFQTQQFTNHLNSAPALTATQQASESALSSGYTSSTSNSFRGSQSQSSTGYVLSQGVASQYGNIQTQQGTNLQTTEGATKANGSSTSSPSFTGSQGQTAYWLLLRLPSQYTDSQAHQGINQLGSVPGLNVHQASASPVSSGYTSSTSNSFHGSQSQSSTGYGLFQVLASQFSGGQSSSSSAFVNPQASEIAVSSGSTSSISGYSGSQSQGSTVNGLSQGFSIPYGSIHTQQGTNQLNSAPTLTVTQQTTEGAETANGSSTSSTSSSFTGSQGPTGCHQDFRANMLVPRHSRAQTSLVLSLY
ncbi:hypothetical protein AMELA_G00153450 [Ameiurus melas]|uniref:Uncharacterized protein n=1 Tax=Ameiurus melas TaxID=219545 RepID=A0A7J6AIR2_AMEME|nr:hypothetical protein AMELA_G00153450 [Ameiurus melas]